MSEERDFKNKVLTAKEKIDAVNNGLRGKLIKFCQTKVRTTMIGALAAFEKNFESVLSSLSKEDQDLIKEAFSKTREEILDLGNQQIRAVDHEIQKHDVSKRVYSFIFKVKGDQE